MRLTPLHKLRLTWGATKNRYYLERNEDVKELVQVSSKGTVSIQDTPTQELFIGYEQLFIAYE